MLKSRKLKIAIDVREFKRDRMTGIARFLKIFLDNIHPEARERIYLLADNNTDTSFYENLFRIKRARAPFTLWYDQVVIPQILKNENIDVFLSPYYKMPFFTRSKKLIIIHDLHFLKNILRKGIIRFKPYITYLKQAVRYSDKIITVSEFTKKEIIKQFNVKEDKIKVIYNGVDNKFKVLDRSNLNILETKYNINFRYILYVGNMKPHKNLKGLIEAYNLLGNKEKDKYKLIIVAKKDENFRELRRIVELFSLENNIVFLDFVFDDDLILFYNFAEVFVFPSFFEGFGLPPLETMACGTPVIASNAASLPEVLGNAALLLNPEDTDDFTQAMKRVLTDDALRKSMVTKGLEKAKLFKTENMAEGFIQVLEECGKDL